MTLCDFAPPPPTHTQAQLNAARKARMARLGQLPKPRSLRPKIEPTPAVEQVVSPDDMVLPWPFLPCDQFVGPRLPEDRPPPTIRHIQNVVCAYYGICHVQLLSRRRAWSVVIPRQVAMYLCKTLTTKAFPYIGRAFDGRDHTTVMHAVERVEAKCAADPEFAAVVDRLRRHLSGESVG